MNKSYIRPTPRDSNCHWRRPRSYVEAPGLLVGAHFLVSISLSARNVHVLQTISLATCLTLRHLKKPLNVTLHEVFWVDAYLFGVLRLRAQLTLHGLCIYERSGVSSIRCHPMPSRVCKLVAQTSVWCRKRSGRFHVKVTLFCAISTALPH